MVNEAQESNTTPPTGNESVSQATPTKNTLMAVLAYLGILIIIPFLAAKDDPFVKFHIKQGLVLFIIEIVVSVAGMGMMWGFNPVYGIINVALFILSIIGIVYAVQGKEKRVPLVGHLSDNFTF